ncbi:MAG: hypothetical protein GXY23_08700 [Myxococcales bacterium]|nr:hypothetical protein [Myxococcales bacterium]
MSEPAVRARSAQQAFEYLASFEPDALARVRAEVPDEIIKAIESAPPTSFLPLSLDGLLVRGIVRGLGEERAERFWRSFVVEHVRTPALKPLIDTAVRLFGVNPGTFFWALAKGLDQSYRDFGKKDLERDTGFARFTLSDFHPELLRFPEYFVALRAICGAMIDLARADWSLESSVDTAARRFVATARSRH